VNRDVKAEKLNKAFTVSKPKEVCKIPGIILGGINGRELALAENIAVDATSNIGELGNTMMKVNGGGKGQNEGTYRSIASSKVGPQYSFLEMPS